MGLFYLKGVISPLPLLLGVWNVKTTYSKSWPGNLFQMLNLTFDPCFKSNGVNIQKCPDISLLIGPIASDCRNSPREVLACKCFACEKFRRLFENH